MVDAPPIGAPRVFAVDTTNRRILPRGTTNVDLVVPDTRPAAACTKASLVPCGIAALTGTASRDGL